VLTQSASWRWFFFINIPVGIAVIILTLANVEESKDETFTGRIDWTGFGLITAGMVLFILALQDSGTEGWGSPLILGSLVAGVVLLSPAYKSFDMFKDFEDRGNQFKALVHKQFAS